MLLRIVILLVYLFQKEEKQPPCSLNVNECLVILCGNSPLLLHVSGVQVVLMPSLFQLCAYDSQRAWGAIRARGVT